MRVDWSRIFREHSVEFVDVGPNVKRGNLNIRCPFCGPTDESHHLGVDPETGFWGCWRSASHRGRRPQRLLVKLLHVSWERASEIVGLSDEPDPSDFERIAEQLRTTGFDTVSAGVAVRELVIPPECKPILPYGLSRRFADYLVDIRKFLRTDLADFTSYYGLKCAWVGDWKDRILVPITLDGTLVSWTSRAIGTAYLRYKDLDKEQSIVPPKQTLFNFDRAMTEPGKILFVLEGPFDVLKLDYYGKGFGCRAVGLFTKTISEQQKYALLELADLYTHVVVMLDSENVLDAIDTARMVDHLGEIGRTKLKAARVPFGYKDPGDMSPGRVKLFAADASAGRISFEL